MGSQVTNGNWTNILKLSICSASLAALGYWAWKYKYREDSSSSLWRVFDNILSRSKSSVKKTFTESLDTIGTSVEEWIEVLKHNYLSEETQEVLYDIQVLIGWVLLLLFILGDILYLRFCQQV